MIKKTDYRNGWVTVKDATYTVQHGNVTFVVDLEEGGRLVRVRLGYEESDPNILWCLNQATIGMLCKKTNAFYVWPSLRK